MPKNRVEHSPNQQQKTIKAIAEGKQFEMKQK